MEDFAGWPEKGHKVEQIDPLRLERTRKENLRKQQDQHKRVAVVAQYNIKAAKLQKHPYLGNKGFPGELGLVLSGDLLVPMRDCRTMNILSLQRISAGGDKKFMTGGSTKGAVYVIGRRRNTVCRIFCEGYATGLSIRAALDYMRQPAEVWVCFSASNMIYVADKVGGRRYVVADNDASGTGQKAAESIGLPWMMPDTIGQDFNDLHQSDGLGACVRLLRGLLSERQTA
jgi:putative DNA primase/helicase